LADAGDIWLYATPILHGSKAALESAQRRVLQVDFAVGELPGGLTWLGFEPRRWQEAGSLETLSWIGAGADRACGITSEALQKNQRACTIEGKPVTLGRDRKTMPGASPAKSAARCRT